MTRGAVEVGGASAAEVAGLGGVVEAGGEFVSAVLEGGGVELVSDGWAAGVVGPVSGAAFAGAALATIADFLP